MVQLAVTPETSSPFASLAPPVFRVTQKAPFMNHAVNISSSVTPIDEPRAHILVETAINRSGEADAAVVADTKVSAHVVDGTGWIRRV